MSANFRWSLQFIKLGEFHLWHLFFSYFFLLTI